MTDREFLLKFALFLQDNDLTPNKDSVEAFIEDEGTDPDDDEDDENDDLDDEEFPDDEYDPRDEEEMQDDENEDD